MSRLRIGFLMDPLGKVEVGHDTTFALMLEAGARGHEVLVFEQPDLRWAGSEPRALMRSVTLRRQPSDFFDVIEQADRPLGELDVILLRKDPPVDAEFLHATQLVELADGPLLVNRPSGLRDANEKLFALRFPDLLPETLVSRDAAEIRAFVKDVGGEAILKPIDGYAGRGILHLRSDDRNARSLLEVATRWGAEAVVVQRYLPESREGDKRILLLDGEPIGSLLRVPAHDDVRGNLAAGGSYEKSPLTARDREICERVAPGLRERGLWFVGLDVIGRHLTEINVTSPTGLEEINRVEDAHIETQVIEFLEERAGSR